MLSENRFIAEIMSTVSATSESLQVSLLSAKMDFFSVFVLTVVLKLKFWLINGLSFLSDIKILGLLE